MSKNDHIHCMIIGFFVSLFSDFIAKQIFRDLSPSVAISALSRIHIFAMHHLQKQRERERTSIFPDPNLSKTDPSIFIFQRGLFMKLLIEKVFCSLMVKVLAICIYQLTHIINITISLTSPTSPPLLLMIRGERGPGLY